MVFFIGLLFNLCGFAQEIELELFATGLTSPVNIQNAGDSRLFILERSGLIKILNKGGALNKEPFLNISNRVNNGEDERGLLGLAFHQKYASNGYFYVNYVNNDQETIISRFSKHNSNDQLADQDSEVILMTIPQPYPSHNGGNLVFGNDGKLFIALGDGGGAGDPENRAQDLTTYLGKILRIDVDQSQNGNNYGIPEDNPYVNNQDALAEIWASGLRNPWKFSIDKTTNEMWIADVGQENIEEINKVDATKGGLNFGWRCYEGNSPYNLNGCPESSGLTFPISEYSHNDSGDFKCSITGGFRYRGSAHPNLSGIYLFADYCSSEIGMLVENGDKWTMNFSKVLTKYNWSTFGEDITGELYIADITSGSIYKITSKALNTNENNLSQIKLYPNPVNDELIIDFGTQINRISDINIYNIQGQQIKTLISFDSKLLKVSTLNLTQGIYILEIIDSNGQKLTQKFVKD